MVAKGLLVMINSDDPTMFHTDIGTEYVKMVEDGHLHLDAMVSRRFTLAEVNEAFAATAAGEVLRGVLI